MNVLKYKRSNLAINILIAVVIALTVNFSYLLSMIVAERETADQRQIMEQERMQRPEAKGVLQLSPDGYGYLIVDNNTPITLPDDSLADSIYVGNRKIRWYNLQQGDTILCTFFPPRPNSRANPSLDEVRQQNGNDISAPVIYDRPKRNQDTMTQMIYYFLLTWLLLTVMTFRIDKRSNYLYRCATVIAITVACYFLAPSVSWMTGKSTMIFRHQPHEMINWMVIMKCTISLVVAILYGRIYQLIYQQQKVLLENEHLRTENIQSRYNMLVGQINPHFFFNSLNGVSALVRRGEDERTLEYVDKLSDIFRYTLHSDSAMLVSLGEELKFVDAFSHVMEVRFASKLLFEVNVPAEKHSLRIPVLSLLPLLENVAVHNTVDSEHRMMVKVSLNERDQLVVENPIYPKLQRPVTNGIGLKNLQSRFELMMGTKVEASDQNGVFRVVMQLKK